MTGWMKRNVSRFEFLVFCTSRNVAKAAGEFLKGETCYGCR